MKTLLIQKIEPRFFKYYMYCENWDEKGVAKIKTHLFLI